MTPNGLVWKELPELKMYDDIRKGILMEALKELNKNELLKKFEENWHKV